MRRIEPFYRRDGHGKRLMGFRRVHSNGARMRNHHIGNNRRVLLAWSPYRLMLLCGAGEACMVRSYIEHVGCRQRWYNLLPSLSGLQSWGRSRSFISLVCRTPLADSAA